MKLHIPLYVDFDKSKCVEVTAVAFYITSKCVCTRVKKKKKKFVCLQNIKITTSFIIVTYFRDIGRSTYISALIELRAEVVVLSLTLSSIVLNLASYYVKSLWNISSRKSLISIMLNIQKKNFDGTSWDNG